MNKTNAIMMSQDDSSKGHILVVGHVTRDIFEDRQQLGGAATYASEPPRHSVVAFPLL